MPIFNFVRVRLIAAFTAEIAFRAEALSTSTPTLMFGAVLSAASTILRTLPGRPLPSGETSTSMSGRVFSACSNSRLVSRLKLVRSGSTLTATLPITTSPGIGGSPLSFQSCRESLVKVADADLFLRCILGGDPWTREGFELRGSLLPLPGRLSVQVERIVDLCEHVSVYAPPVVVSPTGR